jgi:hypothetical protein
VNQPGTNSLKTILSFIYLTVLPATHLNLETRETVPFSNPSRHGLRIIINTNTLKLGRYKPFGN